MKLIIAGGRKYEFSCDDFENLDYLLTTEGITEVVSGGCSGADKEGEWWADFRCLKKKIIEADWDKYRNTTGKNPAGPIRNREMAEYADAVALFPGNKGTQSMYNEAKRTGLKIFDFRNECR